MTIQEKLMVVAIAGILGALVAQPYFEARAFNKFSTRKVSYFEAAVADLRITPER